MHKKKRSAKQLANDRRLGRMAKKRGKKKVTRRKNSKRTALKKSHLWLIWRSDGKTVGYLGAVGKFTAKGNAVRFTTKQIATKTLYRAIDNETDTARGTNAYGIADDLSTPAKIRALFKRPLRKGKA